MTGLGTLEGLAERGARGWEPRLARPIWDGSRRLARKNQEAKEVLWLPVRLALARLGLSSADGKGKKPLETQSC